MSLDRLKVLTPYVGGKKIDRLGTEISNLLDVLAQLRDDEIIPELVSGRSSFSASDIDVKSGNHRQKVWLRVYPDTGDFHFGAEDFYFWLRISRLLEEGGPFKLDRVQVTWKD